VTFVHSVLQSKKYQTEQWSHPNWGRFCGLGYGNRILLQMFMYQRWVSSNGKQKPHLLHAHNKWKCHCFLMKAGEVRERVQGSSPTSSHHAKRGTQILNKRERHTCQIISMALFRCILSTKGKDRMSIHYSLRGLSTGRQKRRPRQAAKPPMFFDKCNWNRDSGYATIWRVPDLQKLKPPSHQRMWRLKGSDHHCVFTFSLSSEALY